jgi:Rrf2 family protein
MGMPGKSTRFTVAVHVMTLLASEEGHPITSDYIAGSVNTNPVVVRRALGLLTKADLVKTIEGTGGGAMLAKAASKISLADVFRAVEQGELFSLPRAKPNPRCPVGKSVQGILAEHTANVEKAIEKEMEQVTVADILDDVRRQS